MSESQGKSQKTEEQRRRDQYSFIIGMIIGMVILIAFTLLFSH
ncbi:MULTISPECIES: hypothetical protein [Thermogemmatispora]|jgi:hypothetical protein|nr:MULTISPECIES: hypothetical protein [Thermogemmatispora]